MRKVADVCGALKLTKTYQTMRRHVDYAKAKIQTKIMKEIQA